MTSHELARKLLEMPDLPVTLPRGYHCSGEDVVDVTDAFEARACLKKKDDGFYPTDHIHLSYQ